VSSGTPPGQGAREHAERLAVLALDQPEDDAVVPGALRLGREPQVADRAEVRAERDRFRLARDAVDPDRALAARRRVVDARHEVPRHRAPVGGATGAGAPLPSGLPGVAAGGVVDEARRVDAKRAPVERDGPARRDRQLAREDPPAAVHALRRDRLARRRQREVDRDAGVAHPDEAVGQRDGAEPHPRSLAQDEPVAVPHRPE
jgi:hypothetical protein